jgi:hypothetical protein
MSWKVLAKRPATAAHAMSVFLVVTVLIACDLALHEFAHKAPLVTCVGTFHAVRPQFTFKVQAGGFRIRKCLEKFEGAYCAPAHVPMIAESSKPSRYLQ